MKKQQTQGFTLIEMLIVVVVIGLMSGMVFRLVGAIGKSNDVSATQAKLEKVANAVEEFRAVYGSYPPVPQYRDKNGNPFQPIYYEFPYPGTISDAQAQQLANAYSKKQLKWAHDTSNLSTDSGRIFTFGLCSFLIPRTNGTADESPAILRGISNGKKTGKGITQWYDHNKSSEVGDSERDINTIRKILPHLEAELGQNRKIAKNGILTRTWMGTAFRAPSLVMSTNSIYTVRDSWNRDIHYYSPAPYNTYRIWSDGPNGVDENGEGDDIVASRN